MIDKNRLIPVATLLLIGMLVTGPLIGFTDGQILTEKTYYEDNFNEYNETAAELSVDDELQNQYLTDTGAWTTEHYSISQDNDGYNYGDQTPYSNWGLDTKQPYLQMNWQGDDNGRIGAHRKISVPEGMEDPVLMVEHADYDQDGHSNDEIAVYNPTTNTGKAITTRSYTNVGTDLYRISDYSQSDFQKVGSLVNEGQRPWTTSQFDVEPSTDNVTLIRASQLGDTGRNTDGEIYFRQIYWTEGTGQTFQTEVNGFESVSEDDSFGGPDPYNLFMIKEQTPEGEEISMRSSGSTVTREFTLDGISGKPENIYFELDATSQSTQPINWRIEQYGQDVATGSISAESSAEDTAELELNDDTFTLYIESGGQYDVHGVTVTALEETSEGDPLASEGPVVLDAQGGYDSTMGVLINALDLTTSTLLYIVMIALIIGAMAFSYTKSVRGQEFGQSMMYGAIITGVVMVGLVPTMNAATWIFTGGTDRAPLANPALEAEPPTYYSTEFQAGTMDGWESTKGMARPVSSGEGFNLDMTADGQSAVVQRKVHISLGNSLDTGFVRLGATASSTPGYTSNPHETSLRMRVYVTDGGEPNWESKTTDLTDENLDDYDDLVVAQEWARSFDGQVVNEEGTVSFPLEGNTVYVEIVADDNRNDELATGSVNWIAVGATTEGTGEAV